LIAKVANLEAEVARLRAKQGPPPKTPNNSSIPPSQGHKKTTEFVKNRRKKRTHPGAHRPLHPNPTHRRVVLASACGHYGADVSGTPQAPCEVYDRLEIPPIAPEITRVSLHGGVCPCCAKRFKAEAPEGLEPGSPFGPNLRAFVIYLRFTQGVAFERLSRLMKDLFGLDISEGALVNILSAARFAAASAAIRGRLLSGRVICSDETGFRVGKRSRFTHELNCNVMDSARGVVMLAHNAHDVQVGERNVHANRLAGVNNEWLTPEEAKAFRPILNISRGIRYPVVGTAPRGAARPRATTRSPWATRAGPQRAQSI
jgi:transposase